MRLDEVWKALDVDISWGIVYALQTPCASMQGALIGSPIAAGAASLVVAHREHMKRKLMKKRIFDKIARCVMQKRWLDDSIQIQKRKVSKAAEEELNLMKSMHFYGPPLRLLPVPGREAFGFLVDWDQRGVIRVRPKWSFVHKKSEFLSEMNGGVPLKIGLNGGIQYRSQSMERGVAVGHFVRILDMANTHKVEVGEMLARMAIELWKNGASCRTVRYAIGKAERQAGVKWDLARSMLVGTKEKALEWAAHYDAREVARWE